MAQALGVPVLTNVHHLMHHVADHLISHVCPKRYESDVNKTMHRDTKRCYKATNKQLHVVSAQIVKIRTCGEPHDVNWAVSKACPMKTIISGTEKTLSWTQTRQMPVVALIIPCKDWSTSYMMSSTVFPLDQSAATLSKIVRSFHNRAVCQLQRSMRIIIHVQWKTGSLSIYGVPDTRQSTLKRIYVTIGRTSMRPGIELGTSYTCGYCTICSVHGDSELRWLLKLYVGYGKSSHSRKMIFRWLSSGTHDTLMTLIPSPGKKLAWISFCMQGYYIVMLFYWTWMKHESSMGSM